MKPIVLRVDDTRTIKIEHCYGNEIDGIRISVHPETESDEILYIECLTRSASLRALAYIRSQLR